MFKRFISLAIFLIFSLSLSACMGITINAGGNWVTGSGNLASETRQVSGFDQVMLTGSGDATITVGDGEGITIEAEDNILPLIETTVQNGKLVVGLKPMTSISTTRGIRYIISARALRGVELTGSSSVSVRAVKSDSFQAITSGSGSIQVSSLQAKTLKVSITGSGKVDVNAGNVDSQDVILTGSGNYNADGVESASAQVATTGSGSAALWVNDTLTARITGSGNVRYYGQPSVTRTETGSGRVTSLGSK